MIIYHESKAQYLADVDNNGLKQKLVDTFRAKTGSVPADHRVWADEYRAFAQALQYARTDDDIEVAIEYHISAAGRFRVDALLAGHDGRTDSALIVELKAWDTADLSDVPEMVISPIGGRTVSQHPSLQARKYKGLILRFNQDIEDQAIRLESAAYLFNLHRRTPEPLEDTRYQHILQDSPIFLANDVSQLRGFIERTVPRKPQKKVIALIEGGRLRPTAELVNRVSSMLEGNDEFDLIDEQNTCALTGCPCHGTMRVRIGRRAQTGSNKWDVSTRAKAWSSTGWAS